MVVQGHEGGVDDDAEGDEELGEGVEDKIGEDLSTLDPDSGAIPDAEKVTTSLQTIRHNVFHFWPLVVLVLRITFSERQILHPQILREDDFYTFYFHNFDSKGTVLSVFQSISENLHPQF